MRRATILVASSILWSVLSGAGGAQPGAGRLIFATGSDGASDRLELAVMNPDGTGFRKVTHHRPSGFAPRWSTSGRHILFEAHDSFLERTRYWRMRPSGTDFAPLPALAWDVPSPSGNRVVWLANNGAVIANLRGRPVARIRFRVGSDELYAGPPLWSPDERWIAFDIYGETDSGEWQRVVVARADGKGRPRTFGRAKAGSEIVVDSWSTRRDALALARSDRVYLTSVREGKRRLIARGVGGQRLSWAPGGRRFAYIGVRGGVHVGGTGSPRRVVRTHVAQKNVRHLGVAWSRRGSWLAYIDSDGIYVARPDGSRRRRIVAERIGNTSLPDWSPDDRRLVYSVGRDIFLVSRRGGPARRLTDPVWDDSPRWSPDGSHVAFVRGSRGLADPDRVFVYVMSASGSSVRRVARGYAPRWSPDGIRLAYLEPDARSDSERIMVASSGGGVGREVARGFAPAWSPDGRSLAFMEYAFNRDDEGELLDASSTLVVVGADGTARRPLFTTRLNECQPIYVAPDWSPDGTTIVVGAVSYYTYQFGCAEESSDSRLALVDVGTGAIRPLEARGFLAQWSPAGDSILYSNGERIASIARDGTGDRTLAGSESDVEYAAPVWSPDGRRVAYVRRRPGDDETGRLATYDVYVVSADGTGRKQLTRTPGVEGALDWSGAGG